MNSFKRNTSSRSINLMYLLACYVVIQLAWWGYRIVSLTDKAFNSSKTDRTILMIVSEGSIFVIILALAIWKFRSSMKKEKEHKEREDNMLLAVTHELKTPLSSAKLCLDTIKARDLNPEQLIEVIETGQQSLNRLNLLIDNLLLSKDLSHSNTSKKEKLNLLDVCVEFKSSLNNERISIDIKQPIIIDFNREEFLIVLSNIIQNALKYSKGEVIITSVADALLIKDTGDGIPDKEKNLVFDKFYRSGSELTRTNKGTGIGLFLVKKLVKNNGAEISIEDNKPKGTVLKITFEK